MKNLLIFLGLILWFSSCQNNSEKRVEVAFYHWKTNVDISDFEKDYLKIVSAQKVFLRFFDVDWDGATSQTLPIAEIELKRMFPDSIEIVPTIFITNRTFLNLPSKDIPNLAENVAKKIFRISSKFRKHPIKEWQFDCDWSSKTQANFFKFLEEIRSQIHDQSILLSSTIRLHQIKFFEKTGIPPVGRGTLMFYNMGNVEDIAAKNSILDINIANQYLKNFKNYPLPLDIALPLFSWGVLFREGRMIKLINNLSALDLGDEARFSKIDEIHFEVIKSTYLQGYYLYKGDVIRLETVPVNLLQQSADLLNELLVDLEFSVIFYHLDSLVINNYPHEALEDICNRFR